MMADLAICWWIYEPIWFFHLFGEPMCSQKECPTKFETRWLQEIPFSKELTDNYCALRLQLRVCNNNNNNNNNNLQCTTPQALKNSQKYRITAPDWTLMVHWDLQLIVSVLVFPCKTRLITRPITRVHSISQCRKFSWLSMRIWAKPATADTHWDGGIFLMIYHNRQFSCLSTRIWDNVPFNRRSMLLADAANLLGWMGAFLMRHQLIRYSSIKLTFSKTMNVQVHFLNNSLSNNFRVIFIEHWVIQYFND